MMGLSKGGRSSIQSKVQKLLSPLPENLRNTLYLRVFSLMQIPVLFFIRPKVLRVDEKGCTVVIPLNRRTKNHLGCMYFGVLACGADIAGGLVAMKAIDESGEKISLIFKDFQAQFLKRVEGDCHFVSDDADRVKALVQEAIQTGDRVETSVSVVAHVPGVLDEPAATFQLTLSLKKKS